MDSKFTQNKVTGYTTLLGAGPYFSLPAEQGAARDQVQLPEQEAP